jgi:hypothetical protein
MKNLNLTFLLLCFSGLACYSQSLSLADDFGPIANGAEIVQAGPSDTLQIITWLHLTNQSGNSIGVMMKKEEISMLPETISSICWAGYCYAPEIVISSYSLTIPPGETVSGCFAHFGPHGSRGVSTIRWTFFLKSDPNDSLSVTVHYSTYPAATGNIPDPQFSISPSGPVPADNQIGIRYSVPPQIPGRITLRNPAGKLISVRELDSRAGTVIYNTTDLPSGIYYCTLVIDGKAVKTMKIPVCH